MKHHLVCFVLILAASAQGQLIPPLEGVGYKDWFITNYVDRDKDKGDSIDYRCGPLTYDGHRGTDFQIHDFRQMDSGVHVIAAASGRVYFIHDGEFDRSKRTDTAGHGNFISIHHRDSIFTVYAHLRKHSMLVSVGDSVVQGQRIALVGSSGKSQDPHVHFEVYKDGRIIDPFGKACETEPPLGSLFTVTPEYHNELHYIKSAVASGAFGLDSVREAPSQHVFTMRDSFITYWVLGLSIHSGARLRADWYTPLGKLWHSHTIL